MLWRSIGHDDHKTPCSLREAKWWRGKPLSSPQHPTSYAGSTVRYEAVYGSGIACEQRRIKLNKGNGRLNTHVARVSCGVGDYAKPIADTQLLNEGNG
jgi:hypothetical protein